MKKIIWTFFFGLYVSLLSAQITFNASVSKNEVSMGERFRVMFVLNMQGASNQSNDFSPPKFQNFQKLMGPSVYQEFQNYNGRISYQETYSMLLQPKKTGTFEIGPASISVNGKKYQTQTIRVKVVKGKVNNNSQQTQRENKNVASITKRQAKDIFLVAETTTNTPYENQAVGLTYKLYISREYGVNNYAETSQPQYNGFWAQDINRNISGPFQGEIKGKSYTYYILRKKLLFPQSSGKLEIKPLSLNIDLLKPVIRQMGFLQYRDHEIQRVKLSSGKKTLRVKSLPEEGKPIDFSGAVGNFEFKVDIDKNKVQTEEPVSITIQARGIGNLKLFELPKLKAPNGLEVYEPKHTENVKSSFSGNQGVIRDEYTLIPNKSGKFIIPAISFSYFDPKLNNYVVKSSGDLVLFVSGNDSSQISSNINRNNQGVDFRYIKEKAEFQAKKHYNFYNSKLFYFLSLFPFFIAPFIFLFHRYNSNKVIDFEQLKAKKSKELSDKYLKDAKNNIQHKEKFYATLEKAFHNFLKAKLKIDTSEMSRDNISRLLSERKVSQNEIDKLIEVLNRCDFARYAPSKETEIQNDYQKAVEILSILDKQIKK